MLTPAQIATLGTYITSQPDLASLPVSSDGNFEVARLLNLEAVPTFWVYKSLVQIKDIGESFNGAELAGLTTGNISRLTCIGIFSRLGINPSRADVRAFFADVFSGAGGVLTRANLDTLWRRPARRIERLFATGTGSTAAPGTLVFEGVISPSEVEDARTA